MLFQPGPEPFVRVEFGGVGGQAVDPKTGAVAGQGSPGSAGAMRVETVLEQKDRPANAAQEVLDEANHLRAGDGAG